MNQDVESLKVDRKSKFKTEQLNFDTQGGNTTVLDEHLKRELTNLRANHESLFEKIQLTSDKIVALEVEINALQRNDQNKDDKGGANSSPFAEDLRQQ